MAGKLTWRHFGIILVAAFVGAFVVAMAQQLILGRTYVAITGGVIGAVTVVISQWLRNRPNDESGTVAASSAPRES